MDSFSNGTNPDAASKVKKVASKQVPSRYLQTSSKSSLQQLDAPQTVAKPSIPRQGYSARTTGKWGSSHYSSHQPASQSSSSLHLVDISTPAPTKPKHPSAPEVKTELNRGKRFVPATPAVPEVPERDSKWSLRRPSGAQLHSANSERARGEQSTAADDDDEHTNGSTAMEIDDDLPSSSNHVHPNDDAFHNSNNEGTAANSTPAKQTEQDKHQERLRLLEEYRQKKQAQKLLQSQKKAPNPALNWRHSLSGQHDISARRESLRGPRAARPSSPTGRRMTISNPPPKFSLSSSILAQDSSTAAVPGQEPSRQASQQGPESQTQSDPNSPAARAPSRPNSAPSPSSDHPGPSSRDNHHPASPHHTSHTSRSASASHVVSMSAPGPLGPTQNTWIRESMSSTGSGSYHSSQASEKPLSESERLENFKRRRRNMQKLILMYRHLNLRTAQAMKQRKDKAETEIHALLVLADQQQDEAARLEREAARRERQKLLDDSLAMQLPLLEQHHQQETQSTAVLNALHQGLLAALTHVPLINGACVGANPSVPDLAALQTVLHKGVDLMKDMQPALERLLTEPLQASLPSTENAGEASNDPAAAAASVSSGKGGVELAAEVAKELAHTMTREVEELQECVELLRRLKAKENHNASYRVQLVQMKQAGLL